jgi:DNA-binding NtrC family response regulator
LLSRSGADGKISALRRVIISFSRRGALRKRMRSHSETRVLLVDDDEPSRLSVARDIASLGFKVDQACDGQDALDKLEALLPNIVVTDLMMPRMDGFDLMRTLKQLGKMPPVIVLSAFGNTDTAVRTVHEFGAFWFLEKPIQFGALQLLLERAANQSYLVEEGDRLQTQLANQGSLGNVIGASRAMQQIFSQIRLVAPSRAAVFITGESGTGKEVVARAIHQLSPRREGPFLAVNCAALPETLVESELFGHEKGSFTGAVERRQGCFELAETGTLLLDELAEMPIGIQAKLLRVLEGSHVRRIGGKGELPVDVRLIAATNRPLDTMIRDGALREDLYYRLNVFHIGLPPLRERTSDLPDLVKAIIGDMNKRHGRSVAGVNEEVMAFFREYPWPGNIRELRNVLERAVILASERLIAASDLSPAFRRAVEQFGTRPPRDAETIRLPVGTTVDEAERALIRLTMAHTNNNKARAAEMLGICLKTLFSRLKEERTGGRTGTAA